MKVRILGSGTSSGVPRIGNDWGVCDPAEPRNRRTARRSSSSMRAPHPRRHRAGHARAVCSPRRWRRSTRSSGRTITPIIATASTMSARSSMRGARRCRAMPDKARSRRCGSASPMSLRRAAGLSTDGRGGGAAGSPDHRRHHHRCGRPAAWPDQLGRAALHHGRCGHRLCDRFSRADPGDARPLYQPRRVDRRRAALRTASDAPRRTDRLALDRGAASPAVSLHTYGSFHGYATLVAALPPGVEPGYRRTRISI